MNESEDDEVDDDGGEVEERSERGEGEDEGGEDEGG